MRTLRVALLCLLVLGISTASLEAQTEDTTTLQDRHITPEQIKALEKALADQPKGTILIESLGWFPQAVVSPPPPTCILPAPPLLEPVAKQLAQPVSEESEFDEAKSFTDQLADVLQKCGYELTMPSGSRGLPANGISIRLFQHTANPIAESLRDCLGESHVKHVQIEKASRDNPYFSPKVLMEITIGSP
jgi:hypothetical protein